MHAEALLATLSLSGHPAGKRGGGGSGGGGGGGGGGGVRVRRGEHMRRGEHLRRSGCGLASVVGRVRMRMALGLGCGRPLWRRMMMMVMMMVRVRSTGLSVVLGCRVCRQVGSAAAGDHVVRRHGRHPRPTERKLIALVLAVVPLAGRRVERLSGGRWAAAVGHRHYSAAHYGAAHYGASLILSRRGASLAVLAQHPAIHLQTRRLHLLAQSDLARRDAKRARQPRDACAQRRERADDLGTKEIAPREREAFDERRRHAQRAVVARCAAHANLQRRPQQPLHRRRLRTKHLGDRSYPRGTVRLNERLVRVRALGHPLERGLAHEVIEERTLGLRLRMARPIEGWPHSMLMPRL
jgi:hypothetical protein